MYVYIYIYRNTFLDESVAGALAELNGSAVRLAQPTGGAPRYVYIFLSLDLYIYIYMYVHGSAVRLSLRLDAQPEGGVINR